jgi:hypothetical protein
VRHEPASSPRARNAERPGNDRYEIVSRDGSTSETYSVSDGEITTISKHSAEGYIHCVDPNGIVVTAPTLPSPPAPRAEESALVEAKEPKSTDTAEAKAKDKAACEMQGGGKYCH